MALRYLGPSKRGKRGAPKVDEAQARRDMGELSKLLGRPAQKMPEHLKDIVRSAQATIAQHRGL